MKDEIKVGDRVEFKEDIEGSGYVVEIITDSNCYGETKRYVIANRVRDCSPWHIMARFSHKHKCNVVYTERVWVY